MCVLIRTDVIARGLRFTLTRRRIIIICYTNPRPRSSRLRPNIATFKASSTLVLRQENRYGFFFFVPLLLLFPGRVRTNVSAACIFPTKTSLFVVRPEIENYRRNPPTSAQLLHFTYIELKIVHGRAGVVGRVRGYHLAAVCNTYTLSRPRNNNNISLFYYHPPPHIYRRYDYTSAFKYIYRSPYVTC